MMSLKLIAFTSSLLAVVPYALTAIPAGSNTYLPPTTKNGYNYNTPKVPFPTPSPTPRRPGTVTNGVKPTVTFPGPGPTRPTGPPGYPSPPQPGYPSTPSNRPPGPGEPGHVHIPGMPFDFQYAVNDIETANDYSHKATSDGDVTTGEYRVQLPDGRTQVVRYTADWKTGYHADVSYEGQATYPEGPSVFGGQSGSQGYRY